MGISEGMPVSHVLAYLKQTYEARVVNCNVVEQRLNETLFACFMAAKVQARSQNLADSVVQRQRLFMDSKHERNVSIVTIPFPIL